jgi:hypothetical protein
MQRGKWLGSCVIVAAFICLASTPVSADQLMLRCDSPKDSLSFSVLIDSAKRQVLNIGFGSKIITEQFSETVIAATDKDSEVGQNLVIDRITGQFTLSWASANEGKRGGDYEGTCAPARRLF